MEKRLVRIIVDCAQCDHMHYSLENRLYTCIHPKSYGVVLEKPGFPEECPLEDAEPQDDIVEPGC